MSNITKDEYVALIETLSRCGIDVTAVRCGSRALKLLRERIPSECFTEFRGSIRIGSMPVQLDENDCDQLSILSQVRKVLI